MSMLAARLAARLHGRRGLTWLRERHAECPESEVCTRRLPLWCGGTRGWVVTTRSRPTEYGASTREVGNSKPGNRSARGPWSHDPAPRPTAPQRRHASDELLTQDTRSGLDEQLQEVGGQIVELGAAPLAAHVGLDALAQPGVHGLAEHRRHPSLGLRADARVGELRRHVLRAHDPSAREVDLVRQLEAVDVVVQGVEAPEPVRRALEPGDLPPLEDPTLAGTRAVEVGLHGRRDRPRAE